MLVIPDPIFTPEQIRQRKINKKGIQLNLLLIGENGIGKKSFINSLCNQKCFKEEMEDDVELFNEDNEMKIETHTIDVTEPNSIPIKLKVNITKNFGFNLRNSTNSSQLIKFIENEFRIIFNEEIKINRNPKFEDNRIHVGLYFIKATSKGLNELEIDNMKKLSNRINLIPVIGKADSLTEEEVRLNKQLILKSLEKNDIKIFNFLEDYMDEEYEYLNNLQHTMPFSIISANSGQTRETLWGNIDINDINLCDFKILKYILFGSHIHEFREITISKKYELFRIEQLLNNK